MPGIVEKTTELLKLPDDEVVSFLIMILEAAVWGNKDMSDGKLALHFLLIQHQLENEIRKREKAKEEA